MAKHSPKSLVKSTVGEEGDLDKQQLKELTEAIWEDETKRAFVLDLAEIVTGRNGTHISVWAGPDDDGTRPDRGVPRRVTRRS